MGNFSLGIGKRYLKFFVDNNRSRHVVIQGGRRSSKSFSVYKWVRFLASGQPKTVLVVTATFPALQLAINDFQRACNMQVTGNAIYGYSSQMSNGSIFMFRAFDDYTKAQGTTANILICEEALNIDENIISTLLMSVTDQVFFVFNPTKKSYIDKYILPDKSNYLVTTYRDNPFLTESQVGEFEDMRKRAMLPTASILDVYQWKVYGEGDFSSMAGKVFKLVYNCTDEDFDKVPSPILYGLDFGWVNGEQSDATALVACKIWMGKAYFKELIYSTQLANNKELALRMAELGLDVYSPIVADFGGLGSQRIRALVTAEDCQWTEPQIKNGFSVQNAQKGKIIDGLQRMNQYELYVTDTSYNLRSEFDNYELGNEGKPKSGVVDHALDACRYCVNSYYLNFDYLPDEKQKENIEKNYD